MRVNVALYASLGKYAPEGGVVDDLPEGSLVRDVVARLGVPESELKLVFVNGLHADMDQALGQDDRLGFFPAVGGG